MMTLTVNGEPRPFASGTVAGLLEELSLHQRPVSVLVNGKVVRRAQRGEHELRDGDQVEIIALIGGG